MTETKRDLNADLAICAAASAGPWAFVIADDNVDDVGGFYAFNGPCVCHFGDSTRYYPSEGAAPSPEDITFLEEARTGWPHTIERAISAEAEVERLKAHIKRAIYLLVRDAYVPAEIELDAALYGGGRG